MLVERGAEDKVGGEGEVVDSMGMGGQCLD